ncbi:MAG: biotin--[acetyl-CoA-carboxylase] ligase [Pseudomonadota bacterium]
MTDLDQRRLQQALAGRGLGQPLHLLDATPSSNAHALQLARAGCPHGTLVLARQQSAGHGRQGSSWWHDVKHGLALSLVLRPELPARRATELVHLAALAVDDVVRDCGVRSRLKWPNDVVVQDARGTRKLAGILVETAARGEALAYAVLGVGLNVNTAVEDFPDALRGLASSIRAETGQAQDREAVVAALCGRLEHWLERLQRQGMAGLLDALRQRSATLGQQVEVALDGRRVQGRAVDLDSDGALIVETAGGQQVRLVQPLAG